MKSLLAVAATAAVALASGPSPSDPTVHLSTGSTIYGNQLPGANEFLGVKFANSKRFEAPVDVETPYEQEPYRAKDFGLACMQVGDSVNITYGSEDCLYLNVWQPATAKPADKLPVLVFIFGGSLQFGESEPYNGSALAVRQGIVYATLSYRSGTMGWMPFGVDIKEGKTTGNWGQMDMQSALRWVQREIHNFGGDPNKVSVHGQSSGSFSTMLHMVLPGSKGLFHGLIGESGPLADMLTATESLEKHVPAIAKSVGCPVEKYGGLYSAELKECFQAVKEPVDFTSLTYTAGVTTVVDGVTVPHQPSEIFKKGSTLEFNEVPIVMGFNTNDSMKYVAPRFMNASGTGLRPITKGEYLEILNSTVPKALYEEALKVYPPACENCPENVAVVGALSTDPSFCTVRRFLSSVNARMPGKTFMYRFDYYYQSNPKCSADPQWHYPYLGSKHEDEVMFIYGQPVFMFGGSCCGIYGAKLLTEPCARLPKCVDCYDESFGTGYHAYFNDKEMAFSQLMGDMWAKFAEVGNPSVGSAQWPNTPNGGEVLKQIVLSADLPSFHTIEDVLYNNPAVCQLWDKVADHRI